MEPTTVHATFAVERSYPHPPERVFAAFADPAKKRRWLLPDERHTVEKFELDFRAGGWEHLAFRMGEGAPITGLIENRGTFQDVVPNQRFVSTYTMALNGKVFSIAVLTIELLPTATGTDLVCTHQGTYLEGADGPEMRKHGWTYLLSELDKVLSAGL
jgi:uncharacterized protein YndB with AHSA1/START domain